jgi:predicted AAA+ superfamily ATPase
MMIPRIVDLPKSQSFFLFGPRQTGKSTLVRSRLDEASWSVDLLESDLFLRYARAPEAFRREAEEKIKHNRVTTIFIDEVQRLPDLLNEVHLLIERHGCRFILSGSSARKLRRGGVNLLAGRAVERQLFPFVHSEIEDSFNLEDVLRFGTLPAVHGKPDEEKADILGAYANTYLREEIQQEGLVRNLGGFSRFLDVAAAQCGELVNFSAFGREAGLPTRTVQSYYDILEDTLVGYRLEPLVRSARRRMVAHQKFYLFDTGVTNAVNRRLAGPPDAALRGRLFEQLMVLETIRMRSYLRSEAHLYFWRTGAGAEVDLVVERRGRPTAAFEITTKKKIVGADLTGLRAFGDEHPRASRAVICDAPEPLELEGVRILPWRLFLEELPNILG